jgi:hypothetical protein
VERLDSSSVLALHHEIQYLYFTYAVAKKPVSASSRGDFKFLASFAVWPLIGLATWAGLQILGSRNPGAVPRRRAAVPLLARQPHLDGTGAAIGCIELASATIGKILREPPTHPCRPLRKSC